MVRTISLSALALSAFLAACSSGQPQSSTSGTTGGAGTSTGAAPLLVETVATFVLGGECQGAPSGVTIDANGTLLTVAAHQLLAVQLDGGTTPILPAVGGLIAVAASTAATFVSEDTPIAMYSEASFDQKFLTGGSPGCGNGQPGIDGGVGFARGKGIAAGSDDSLYVADWSQSEQGCTRIRKVDFEGNVTTLAGTGAAGFADGPGITAQFSAPSGLAVDKNLDVYVADSFNSRIRMVTKEGLTSTVAGNGQSGFTDAAAPPNTPSSATFNLPQGVAVDAAGNIYVADTGNNSIRVFNSDAGVTTLAGNGQAGFVDGTLGKTGTATFNYPVGVAVDSMGNVFVADQNNCAIRMIPAQIAH